MERPRSTKDVQRRRNPAGLKFFHFQPPVRVRETLWKSLPGSAPMSIRKGRFEAGFGPILGLSRIGPAAPSSEPLKRLLGIRENFEMFAQERRNVGNPGKLLPMHRGRGTIQPMVEQPARRSCRSSKETTTAKNMTMLEVAAEAGVSPATVSRVLTGSAQVSPTTRRQVYAAVSRLGYLRRGERPGDSRHPPIIAAVICEPTARVFNDPFFVR